MRALHISKYMAVLSFSLLIFVAGIGLGQYIGSSKVDDVKDAQDKERLNFLGLNVQSEIIKQKLCDADIFSLTKNRFDVGNEVTKLENLYGDKDPRVSSLKEEYTLLSINQLLLIQNYKEQCNKNLNIIIYFYSNTANRNTAGNQGYVLDYISKNYERSVAIYSIDSDIKNIGIDTFKQIYNVTNYPTLIINNHKYEGFMDRSDIEKVLTK